jgi:hypothetical protein
MMVSSWLAAQLATSQEELGSMNLVSLVIPYFVELNTDYERKSSVEKNVCGRDSQGAWRQGELIDSKLPVISNFYFDLDFDV